MTLRVKPIRLGNKPSSGSELVILKGTGKDMVIAGYASVDVVDKQNDLITLDALKEASDKFMKSDYKNVMITHSNVQVGEVIDTYTDTKGNVLKTGVDDTGFFVVIKMRNDIEKAKEVARDIRRGKLRSFSIGVGSGICAFLRICSSLSFSFLFIIQDSPVSFAAFQDHNDIDSQPYFETVPKVWRFPKMFFVCIFS